MLSEIIYLKSKSHHLKVTSNLFVLRLRLFAFKWSSEGWRCEYKFFPSCNIRSGARQNLLVASIASRTISSRFLFSRSLYGGLRCMFGNHFEKTGLCEDGKTQRPNKMSWTIQNCCNGMSDMLTNGRKHGSYMMEKKTHDRIVTESMLRMNASCMLVMTTTCMYKDDWTTCATDELHVQGWLNNMCYGWIACTRMTEQHVLRMNA